ncbi:hypothetical protein LVJ94_04080 [Pendulispora rubella]|uniref:PDZ domain-containing protein n=1 Tax=Pendulispora rubella TaxID=2741070 RepID=A0ABZ2L663_9BACT
MSSGSLPSFLVGSIAGNVLRDFRVGIDYVRGVTYLEQHAAAHDGDLDSPGLVLKVPNTGEFQIVALAKPRRSEIASPALPGDRLLTIDGLTAPVRGAERSSMPSAGSPARAESSA